MHLSDSKETRFTLFIVEMDALERSWFPLEGPIQQLKSLPLSYLYRCLL